MFGTLGGPELLLILVIALIVFGPRKLPEIGKSIGKMMVEFRRASNDFKRTIEDEVEADKMRQSLDAPRSEPSALEASSSQYSSEPPPSEAVATDPAGAAPEAAPAPEGTVPQSYAPPSETADGQTQDGAGQQK
jgi:Tat protein translocase TatB subunit